MKTKEQKLEYIENVCKDTYYSQIQGTQPDWVWSPFDNEEYINEENETYPDYIETNRGPKIPWGVFKKIGSAGGKLLYSKGSSTLKLIIQTGEISLNNHYGSSPFIWKEATEEDFIDQQYNTAKLYVDRYNLKLKDENDK